MDRVPSKARTSRRKQDPKKLTGPNTKNNLSANYRFITCPSEGDWSSSWSVDTAPPWEDIELLLTRSPFPPSCPICLDDNPQFPMSTKCGHVFCYLCLLRYLGGSISLKCPVCSEMIERSDFRRVILPRELGGLNPKFDRMMDHVSLELNSVTDMHQGVPVANGSVHAFRVIKQRNNSVNTNIDTEVYTELLQVYPEFEPLLLDAAQRTSLESEESIYSAVAFMSDAQLINSRSSFLQALEDYLAHQVDGLPLPPPQHPHLTLPATKLAYSSILGGNSSAPTEFEQPSSMISVIETKDQISFIREAIYLWIDRVNATQMKPQKSSVTIASKTSARESPSMALKKVPSTSTRLDKTASYFKSAVFQSASGLDIFLHPSQMAAFESLLLPQREPVSHDLHDFPSLMLGQVEAVEHKLVSAELRRKYKPVLNNVPLNAWATFIYIDIVDCLYSLIYRAATAAQAPKANEAQKLQYLKDSNLVSSEALENWRHKTQQTKRRYNKSHRAGQQELEDRRLAERLMWSSFEECQIVRETCREVTIQDLLSGPVVGRTYEDNYEDESRIAISDGIIAPSTVDDKVPVSNRKKGKLKFTKLSLSPVEPPKQMASERSILIVAGASPSTRKKETNSQKKPSTTVISYAAAAKRKEGKHRTRQGLPVSH